MISLANAIKLLATLKQVICANFDNLAFDSDRQPSPLLNTIQYTALARKSRQHETDHYVAQCACLLA